MNILIVGSKGFIGSHAQIYFRTKGCQVWGCDVMVDYASANYILIDATNADFHSLFQAQHFDVCLNCSGAASVPDSLKNPFRDFNLNTHNVFKLLDAIRQYQAQCKFINLSSAAVYGNPTTLPIKETDTLHPLSPYGWHKLQAEQICREFHIFYGIATCSLRIFSAYGNGLKKQLFWDLAQKATKSEPFKLFGTGKESRDFIHVSDIVRVIDLVIQKSKFEADVFNVANGEEIKIQDVVKLFYGFWDEKIDFAFSGEERAGDPNNWVADISLIKHLTYVPTCSVSDGLENYYKWFRKNG